MSHSVVGRGERSRIPPRASKGFLSSLLRGEIPSRWIYPPVERLENAHFPSPGRRSPPLRSLSAITAEHSAAKRSEYFEVASQLVGGARLDSPG